MLGNEFQKRVNKWVKWIIDSLDIINIHSVQLLVSNTIMSLTDQWEQQALIVAEENVISAIHSGIKE